MKRVLPLLVLLILAVIDLLAGHGLHWAGGVLLWKLRLPRMLTAAAAGAAMALSGAQMQALFRNSLADPHIMGVSGGAGLGAVIAALSVTGGSSIGLVGAAFAGALLTALAVVAMASRVQNTATLLLGGVMLGFVLSAASSILQYRAGEESLKLFYNWMAGSFSHVPYSALLLISIALAVGCLLALYHARSLDLLLFGDDFAAAAGLRLKPVRRQVMLGCVLMTGAVTAFCGPVGFVGIAAPHLVRYTQGTAVHRSVLPWSLVYGAALALAGDILAHIGPTPLPVGSTLALVGIPLILVFLWKERF